MSSISIHNIGPIKDVDFILNKINIFIGPQSSGKSTIAKIISFCLWLEKDILIHQDTNYIDEDYINKNLLDFHKLNSYINDKSQIKFDGHIILFEYCKNSYNISIKEEFKSGKLGKIAYIPAERNIITLNGISSLPLGENNLRSFLFDWFNIHSKYTKENPLKIKSLGVKYYFQKNTDKDTLILDNGKEITLNESSSGLQSVAPLYVYLDYMTNWIYEHKEDISFEKQDRLDYAFFKKYAKSIIHDIKDSSIKEMYNIHEFKDQFKTMIEKISEFSNDKISETSLLSDKEKSKLVELIESKENITQNHFSSIIIEEPEQNLFPKTQVELIKDILRNTNIERDNLIITTHSPYILYSINNCMLGWLVKDNITEDIIKKECSETYVDPKRVSIWALNNGTFLEENKNINGTIQDKEGLITNNYFDKIMGNVMSEFNNLMNYYE